MCNVFSKLFTVRRFHLLLKVLHFNKIELLSDYSVPKRLFIIEPIIKYLTNKFKEIYKPERNVYVDELLLLWNVRLGWNVYFLLKRNRFGIKTFVLCESKTS